MCFFFLFCAHLYYAFIMNWQTQKCLTSSQPWSSHFPVCPSKLVTTQSWFPPPLSGWFRSQTAWVTGLPFIAQTKCPSLFWKLDNYRTRSTPLKRVRDVNHCFDLTLNHMFLIDLILNCILIWLLHRVIWREIKSRRVARGCLGLNPDSRKSGMNPSVSYLQYDSSRLQHFMTM